MGMVITMVLTNRPRTQYVLKQVTLVVSAMALLLLTGNSAKAEVKVEPKISANSYAYWYQEQQLGSSTDRGMALVLTPEIRISRTGPSVKTSLFWQEEAVWYHDAQRSQQSAPTYKASNIVSAFNQRVTWELNAAGGYQIRDTQQGVYADIVTSPENLAKTKNYGTNLNFTTLKGGQTQANLSLAYNVFKSDGSISGQYDGYSNDSYRGRLNLGSASRTGAFFWQLSGNYNLTERESFDNFESGQANGILGLPLHSNLSLLLRTGYERNEGSTTYLNEFTSYGAGIELKLGRASWLNVTWNKSNLSNGAVDMLELDAIDDEYLAGEIYLAPSRRTSLSFSIDKRYFGRTRTLNASYNLRFISIRVAANDTVRTQTQLGEAFEDLGIFVCPDGSTDLADCFRPPTNRYIPGTGESFQQAGHFVPELSERIVLSRNILLAIGYTKNKLSLNISASTGEDEYVETQRLTKRHNLTMQGLWKLYSDLTLNTEANFYRLEYTDDDRTDENMSAVVGLTYSISQKTDLKVDARHTRRDSNIDSLDISETRLGLGITYSF
ncbi:outer membrane beta-barrel protein [Rheinheimera sp. MMS21-TC3]|uniref:outer membrane beta-barrel protein n=1 Tax=Rheinheimera sp. MMS21-TC3 TaxID=3072790 RepID=UPI0028C430AB|nr:outer membrane beta-barrel protein [Rheinheimera sp. MMS21-TC3]WNO60702.1 outer membrane beta-barrel protein [Rheinheimera sp. MMS21-TC3]